MKRNYRDHWYLNHLINDAEDDNMTFTFYLFKLSSVMLSHRLPGEMWYVTKMKYTAVYVHLPVMLAMSWRVPQPQSVYKMGLGSIQFRVTVSEVPFHL